MSGTTTRHPTLGALWLSTALLCGLGVASSQELDPLRFFACGEDWSHQSPDAPLPEAVATGAEPFLIVGALAGG